MTQGVQLCFSFPSVWKLLLKNNNSRQRLCSFQPHEPYHFQTHNKSPMSQGFFVCVGGDVNANSWAVILFRVWNISFSSIIFRIYSLRAPTTKLYWTKCLESSVAVPSITKTHRLSESKEMCISSWFYNIKLFSVSYHKPLQHHNRRDTICSSPRSHQICFCSRGEHQAARSLRE